ncbi:uncharacterized protein PHALS_01924 [Plasmopara halstedii]|uniref:Uncharacterized protein n=1 Tax=Plasmopara halstedii TaxID=4781 RepID=A0A0P1AXV4_PLAHL|nr:uncharacterized protein PHALS_01924 [Plasmopara halstedii]CEG45640.1 hypothetical protein PHALS_01924 [Plasmopara halstedii]|eukprot:XP_024582009.1 hypothetical protein PHALS_01924 [Plasmopara halstedii]
MFKLSKWLLHKSWLKSNETPQTLYQRNGWVGKKDDELMRVDPERFRKYRGYDDRWMKAKTKKGVYLEVEFPDSKKKSTRESKKVQPYKPKQRGKKAPLHVDKVVYVS